MRIIRQAILSFFLIATLNIFALPALTTNHTHFIDSCGRIIILHGVNNMNKQPPYTVSAIGFDQRNINFLHQHGFNLVRLGIFWAAIEPKPGQYNGTYLKDITKTIRQLANTGIYTLIDFHQDGFSTKNDLGTGFPTWASLGQSDGFNPGFPMNYLGGNALNGQVISSEVDDNFTQF